MGGGASVRLFVKSVKTVTGETEFERRTIVNKIGDSPDRIEIEGKRMEGTFQVKAYETETEPQYEFILPEDQQHVIETVREVASKHGLEVEIIDVAKESVLHRAVQEQIERVRIFPTLVVGTALKIEGDMTKKQIESILAHAKG